MQNDMIDFLIQILQKESITPNECGIFDLIKAELSDFEVIRLDKNGVKNIFLYKDFSANKNPKIHLCFAGHIDVVPSGEGWSYPPFGGVIDNDVIYSRGVCDMKGGVASFVYAIKEVKQFSGILSILLTSDEEGEGIYGTKIMLEHLKNIDFLPDFALVAEPTSNKILGDVVKIGRRGSINGRLKIMGKQGHVAYPNKCINPIDLIAPLLPKLSNIALDSGDDNFLESRLIITNIKSGMGVVNVTPNDLEIMFNVRNNPLTTQESLKRYIDNVFNLLPYSLELKQSSYPFITESKILIESIKSAIMEVVNIDCKLDTGGGTSDARYFSSFGIEVIELGLLNASIHAIDENSKIDDIIKLRDIFSAFIKKLEISIE
ncbi:succinyl-diaminopimelate desuccinylase [Helicobacter sp. MIT 99-5507]|uniref:succinyl-diaminopimelate desuccinylase n=1 Tax=Helicobacter sp. MIT 99-5507 TaxID=152489 RepID=UPI000E1EE30C|nr:succinyl-diaminopimelate desuccinylase [Helicobacter sp. MIT 99-5507]RDU57250.1 succinyl-diaminopimelate desuccinylase [Helicobacter sp. MIT 99-5507]